MSGEALLHGVSVVLLAFVAIAAISIIVRTLRNGVPPMPSSPRVQAGMIAVIRQLGLPQHATVVELGSGWGSLSLAVSRAVPAAAVVGYENSPVPFWFSVALRRLFRAENLRLVRTNFHAVSLRDADLVICYLSLAAMARLQPKLAAELKASAMVVSSTFALPGWKPTKIAVADDMYRTRIYVYPAGACRSDAAGSHVDILE